jgi:hypothetical protein
MMRDLNFGATPSTPSVAAVAKDGTMTMRGDSYPENSLEFYQPVLAWITEYLDGSDAPFELRLHLLYLNTSSVKAMMDIFEILESAHLKGRKITVRWYYNRDNERIADLAEEFKEDCSFPFDILRGEA